MKPPGFRTTGSLLRLLILCCVAALSVWTAPAPGGSLEFNLSATGGHDDDVLASPGDSLTLPSIKAGFVQLSPKLTGRLRQGRWQAFATALYAHNRYSSEEAGAWNRIAGQAGGTLQLSPEVDLGLYGSAERLRRTQFDDLDVDRLNITPRLLYRPASDVQIELSLGVSRDHYPARTVFILYRTGPETLQTDHPVEAALDVGLYRWDRLALSGGFAGLSTSSSQVISEYAGYRLYAVADFRPGLDIDAQASFAYEYRDYEDREVQRVGDRFRIVDRVREDHSREYALSAARDLTRRARISLDASWIDYVSDLSTVSFDQTRIQARLDFRIGSWNSGTEADDFLGTVSLELPEMAPEVRPGGAETPRVVTFRCRAPEATGVALAGSFNGWDPASMTDDDDDGVWEITTELPAGLYRYMFLIDNMQWQKPAGATVYEEDGFGHENGILRVP